MASIFRREALLARAAEPSPSGQLSREDLDPLWLDRVWLASVIGAALLLLAAWSVPLPRSARGTVTLSEGRAYVRLPAGLVAAAGSRVSLRSEEGVLQTHVAAVSEDGRLLLEEISLRSPGDVATVDLGWEPLFVWGTP